ncbi:hypothetical protein, unknown function [Leishmania mexicana MHOM/GT/2001/U1103]|uniref:Clu domain-containing protein n=1 Tax=Leishmania mexicana (strain MHOM/GT/2001/U1103) TaxID=929439 RepID=E9AQX7_LEIMU|nr:hypothetical protein, unknown function [Leishmania mexicana MHOM/GT/2001/U1103]CBZ25348.1 hypothetical protein, unknown function [Leishmania mexicana MHOM/GT/2001/U1103]
MRDFLEEFEGFAKVLVESLLREGRLPPAARSPSATLMCARYGNVLVYAWPDGKQGMWMQRSFRALMECCVPHLSLPLTATFRYFGDVITVAAVISLERARPAKYAGNGRSDPVAHVPLQELLGMAQDALNLLRGDPRVEATGGANDEATKPQRRKVRGVEVREGMDTRLYVVNCLGLLPPLFSTDGRVRTLRRWLHLIQHPPMRWASGVACADIYRREVAASVQYLSGALQAPVERRNTRLVQLLHKNGLNLSLLGLVAQTVLAAAKEDLDDTSELLLRLIAVEVLARVVRRSLFRSMGREGSARSLKTANNYLQRTAGSLLRPSQGRFEERLLPLVRDMFWLDEAMDTVPYVQLLKHTLQQQVVLITKRLCELCGLRVVRGSVAEIMCQPSHHNYSSFYSPEHQALIATLAQDRSEYPPAFKAAYLLPLRIRFFCHGGRLAEAWREAAQLVELRSHDMSERFLNAEAWTTAALVAAQVGRDDDSVNLIERATRVFFDIPAFLFPSNMPLVRMPSYLYFLRGQVHVKLAHGFICIQRRLFEEAEELFTAVLRLPDVLEDERQPHVAHLRQQAVVGLFNIAVHSENTKVVQLDAQWSAELRSMAPSLQGARISELFGSLFFDRDMFPSAVARLWECLETTEQLLGATALRVGEVLNKLAYVYYRWDARQYGLFCSCILHRAEAIMVEQSGLYSPLHLSIIENIASVFILRGMFVAASQRLHLLSTLPPRYTGRLSREHPAIIRIAIIESKLRYEFGTIAIVIIQRYWREYRSRAILRDVCESRAQEIQRVGRAYLVRRALLHLYYGHVTADGIVVAAQHYAMRTFSRPLICASALFSKEQRHWNSELQHPCLFAIWWERVEQQVQLDERQRLVAEFEVAARSCLQGMRSGTLSGVRVPGCSTSFVMQNMVFTQVPAGHRLSALQLRLTQHLRCTSQCFLTVPLSTLLEFADCAYYAEALIPLHHHPRVVFTVDGHSSGPHAATTRSIVSYMMRQYRDAGLTTYRADNCQCIEIVSGADGLLYLTNSLGLVSSLVHQQPTLDVSALALPANIFSLAWEKCNAGNAKEAVHMLELALLSQDSDEYGLLGIYFLSYLASARFASGEDLDGAMRLFQRCSTGLEENTAVFPAALILYTEGRAWLSRGATTAALDPLLRSLNLYAERIRLHAYYGAFCIFEVALWVLRTNVVWGSKVDVAVLRCVAHAVEFGEPTLSLFITCGRFILYAQRVGDTAMSQQLIHLRDTRARELQPVELDRYLHVLLQRSESLQRRGCNESYSDCVFVHQTAIHMAEAAHSESRMLGVLLTSYGLLLTKMNRLKEARRVLSRANAVLLKTVAPTSPEAMTWRKNNRTLKHRMQDNAIAVIRRAVRLWKERRRLERDMCSENPVAYQTLQAVRFKRRIKSLVVSEATARVLIADSQAEECYRLHKRKGRMRNDAMLKQTYGTRVQVFLDKLDTALIDVENLALATKAVMAGAARDMRQCMLSAFLVASHRVERRGVIGKWRASLLAVKLWHLEHVDAVIRVEFLAAFHAFMRRCVAAAERAWRRIITRNQRKSKQELGKAIGRVLRRKPKSIPVIDVRAVLLNEACRREGILAREEEDYRTLMVVFTFGPEVGDGEEVGVAASLQSTAMNARTGGIW